MLQKQTEDVGVVVGRFQVDSLHSEHKKLLDTTKQKIMHSDTKFSCPDYCVHDAGYNCKQCSRYKNTLYYKLQKNH